MIKIHERDVPLYGNKVKLVVAEWARNLLTPEIMATVQALYSRSNKSILLHLQEIKEGLGKKAKNFMEKYYVGYGHSSIGDCACITVFFEGLSMLAVKVLQANLLYNGQECSTRYMNFSKAVFHLFIQNSELLKEAEVVVSKWRKLYEKHLPLVRKSLQEEFPYNEGMGVTPKVYERAINARAFDICRGLIPAGAETSMSWTGNIRNFRDQIRKLKCHPLEEVRLIVTKLEKMLASIYPHSFKVTDDERYWDIMKDHYYNPDVLIDKWGGESFSSIKGPQTVPALKFKKEKNCPLPEIANYEIFEVKDFLDFASWRDLARHRSVSQRVPLLTTEFGMHPWYWNEIQQRCGNSAVMELGTLLHETKKVADKLSPTVAQYLIPMGCQVPMHLIGNLNAWAYIIELRLRRNVHPTLVLLMKKWWEGMFSNYVEIDVDTDPLGFNPNRGKETIIKK